MAVASTAFNTATTTLETINQFTPQGSAFKNVKNIVNTFRGKKGNGGAGGNEGGVSGDASPSGL